MSKSPLNGRPQWGFALRSRPAWAWPAVRSAALLAGLTIAGTAVAGSFSVSPVRVFMQARERATAITIQNEGDTELVMQAELYEWKQKADGTGAEQLVRTDDLVMAPPVLKVPPRGRQVIRLANLRPVPPGEQLTYRLIVREIPEALAPSPGVQVQVALAFSIPVFITPPGAKQSLTCSTKGKTAAALIVQCENKGQAYAQPVNFSLETSAGANLLSEDVPGGYILPANARKFEVKLGGKALPTGPAKLTVSQDDGSKQSFNVDLSD
jgi:fimbrial chaperone protein